MTICPICSDPIRAPFVTREVAGAEPLVYGRCEACGHAPLVRGAAPPTLYTDEGYFHRRDAGGAGYDDYAAERTYREGRARDLLDWIAEAANVHPPGTLLEVGSGFGFTRRAAAERGFSTTGVDVNPHAAAAARALYGMDTFRGTLAEALASRAITSGTFDLVLYQFVLEHLPDPVDELIRAANALSTNGVIALLLPSADAYELEVFGGAYRSLRHDHLHLFSRASIAHALDAAGLDLVALTSTCNRHLLADRFSPDELRALYASGRGPDLRVAARRRSA